MTFIFIRIKWLLPLTLTVVVFPFSGCLATRLGYDAELETKDNKVYQVEYRESFDTSTHSIVCGLTIWAYGGWCWYFAFIPTDVQRYELISHAKERARKDLNTRDFKITESETFRMGYYDQKPSYHIAQVGGPVDPPVTSPVKTESQTPPIKVAPRVEYYSDDEIAEMSVKRNAKLLLGPRLQIETGFKRQFANSWHFGASYFRDRMGVSAGTALSNEADILGNPLQLGLSYQALESGQAWLRFSGGWTGFFGSGKRGIVYSEGITDYRDKTIPGMACRNGSCRNGIELVRQADWNIQFIDLHARFGVTARSGFLWFLEAIRLLPLYYKLDVEAESGDDRFGAPVGIGSYYKYYEQGKGQSGVGFGGEVLGKKSAATGFLIGIGYQFSIENEQ